MYSNRIMFRELRLNVEQLKMSPRCPAGVRGLIDKVIGFICRLAPQVAPAQQQQQQQQQ